MTSNASGLYNGGILPDAKSLNGSFLNETDSAELKESRIPMVDQPSLRQNAQPSRPKEGKTVDSLKALILQQFYLSCFCYVFIMFDDTFICQF